MWDHSQNIDNFQADHLKDFYAQIRRLAFPLAHIGLSEKASSELGFQTVGPGPTHASASHWKLHDSVKYYGYIIRSLCCLSINCWICFAVCCCLKHWMSAVCISLINSRQVEQFLSQKQQATAGSSEQPANGQKESEKDKNIQIRAKTDVSSTLIKEYTVKTTPKLLMIFCKKMCSIILSQNIRVS